MSYQDPSPQGFNPQQSSAYIKSSGIERTAYRQPCYLPQKLHSTPGKYSNRGDANPNPRLGGYQELAQSNGDEIAGRGFRYETDEVTGSIVD